ncbi:hypothetical protein PHYC_02236 [Phycisphaerales bacterium]|nr:hypothetical protein PHYC_02236 [Phycisphaerales bacterium]
MRILLDHCVPAELVSLLAGHAVSTAGELGWAELKNGALLAAAGAAGFDVIITVDQNLPYQTNLSKLAVAVVLIRSVSTHVAALQALMPDVFKALECVQPRTFVEVPHA